MNTIVTQEASRLRIDIPRTRQDFLLQWISGPLFFVQAFLLITCWVLLMTIIIQRNLTVSDYDRVLYLIALVMLMPAGVGSIFSTGLSLLFWRLCHPVENSSLQRRWLYKALSACCLFISLLTLLSLIELWAIIFRHGDGIFQLIPFSARTTIILTVLGFWVLEIAAYSVLSGYNALTKRRYTIFDPLSKQIIHRGSVWQFVDRRIPLARVGEVLVQSTPSCNHVIITHGDEELVVASFENAIEASEVSDRIKSFFGKLPRPL